jgi:hypothetical protein
MRGARFVILNVIVGEDAGEFRYVCRHQSAISVFEKLQHLPFIVVHL